MPAPVRAGGAILPQRRPERDVEPEPEMEEFFEPAPAYTAHPAAWEELSADASTYRYVLRHDDKLYVAIPVAVKDIINLAVK